MIFKFLMLIDFHCPACFIIGSFHFVIAFLVYLACADSTFILLQVRGKIADFIMGVFTVFQGMQCVTRETASTLPHWRNFENNMGTQCVW